MEEVALTDGKGTYTYAENAFSVKVSYTLALEIEESLQQTLLSAPAALKNGLENMKTAYNASDANLGTVVQAIDILNQLADGISLGWASAKFETQAAIDAARNLRNQILHYDELQLQTWNISMQKATTRQSSFCVMATSISMLSSAPTTTCVPL